MGPIDIKIHGKHAGLYRISSSPVLPHDKSFRHFYQYLQDDWGNGYWNRITPSPEALEALKDAMENAI